MFEVLLTELGDFGLDVKVLTRQHAYIEFSHVLPCLDSHDDQIRLLERSKGFVEHFRHVL